SSVSSTTCWITAVILGILFLTLLGIIVLWLYYQGDVYDSFSGCPCPCCPEQWVIFRGRCYSFSKEKDWNSSQESCWAQGAYLLVISNTSEMVGAFAGARAGWSGSKPQALLWPTLNVLKSSCSAFTPPFLSVPKPKVLLSNAVPGGF
uniref:C-type lectin domain-containing protein n=1 Tax=Taeniopygia guttata TaxID=59729 RepID=A0A674H7Q3_TAEGU